MTVAGASLSTAQQQAISDFIVCCAGPQPAQQLRRTLRSWHSVMTPVEIIAAAEGISVHMLAQWGLDTDAELGTLRRFADEMAKQLQDAALLTPPARLAWLQAVSCEDPRRSITLALKAAGTSNGDPGVVAFKYALLAAELVLVWAAQTNKDPQQILDVVLAAL